MLGQTPLGVDLLEEAVAEGTAGAAVVSRASCRAWSTYAAMRARIDRSV